MSDVELCRNIALKGEFNDLYPRCKCWITLLNSEERRETFKQLSKEWLIDPTSKREQATLDLSLNNPLSQESNSPWQTYFKDQEIRKLIMQDVERAFPEELFFRDVNVQESLVKVLFLHGKTKNNPKYRQGMHEIAAVIFYILNSNPDKSNVEADTFSCFCQLFENISCFYEPSNDSKSPESAKMTAQMVKEHFSILKCFDSELANHLEKLEIEQQYYFLKWSRLLFSREFHFSQIPRLWDVLIAERSNLKDMVNYITVSMLIYVRNNLLGSDYHGCLQRLMKYPPVDNIEIFIAKAKQLKSRFESGSFGSNQDLRSSLEPVRKEEKPAIKEKTLDCNAKKLSPLVIPKSETPSMKQEEKKPAFQRMPEPKLPELFARKVNELELYVSNMKLESEDEKRHILSYLDKLKCSILEPLKHRSFITTDISIEKFIEQEKESKALSPQGK